MGCCEVSLRFSTIFPMSRAAVVKIVLGMTPRQKRVGHNTQYNDRGTMKQAYPIWSRVLAAKWSDRHSLLLFRETWSEQRSDCTHFPDMFTSETTKRMPPPSLVATITSAHSSRRRSAEIKLLVMLAIPLTTPNTGPSSPCLSPSDSPSRRS